MNLKQRKPKKLLAMVGSYVEWVPTLVADGGFILPAIATPAVVEEVDLGPKGEHWRIRIQTTDGTLRSVIVPEAELRPHEAPRPEWARAVQVELIGEEYVLD